MLLELNIENYAIIEDMKINFQKGLNVITGETGSGKSIIIDALGMVLGGRANKDVIKAGKDFCHIEAIFTTYDKDIKDLLESMGIEVDDYLIITKDISKNGPSITRINNRVITSANLLKIIPKIIDVFAQHESISLMNHDNQRNLLDDFCDNKHKENLLLLKNFVHEINELKKDYENKVDSSTNKDREIDILNYQINEINEANLTSYDDKELEEDYLKLNNVTSTAEALSKTINILKSNYEGFNVEDGLDRAIGEVNSVLKYNNELKDDYDELEDVRFRLKELINSIESYMNNLNFDGQKLHELESRLDLVNRLKSKYGKSIDEIDIFLENTQKRLDFLLNSEKNLEQLKKIIQEKEEKALYLAQNISQDRGKLAEDLRKKISNELEELNIKNAKFKVSLSPKKLSYDGIDNVEFLISSNLGEEYKPISKIASGGEMSRIMLAFKSIIANKDNIKTLIFDEIDTGISGKTAQIVGNKIKKLSKDRQVIVISHLPQIISLANCHFLIEKEIKDKKTISKIKMLNQDERVMELARLVGGINITDAAINAAKEMLGVKH